MAVVIDGAGTIAGVTGLPDFTYSGQVLQSVFHTDTGDLNITNTTNASRTIVAPTITPKSTNSKILIRVSFYAYPGAYAASVNYLNLRVYEGTTPVGAVSTVGTLGAANVQAMQAGCIGAVVTNSALTPRSFALWAYMQNASGTGGVGNQVWELVEIQA